MRFSITMNMASSTGKPVHQIIGDHPAASVEELLRALKDEGFVVVEEIHKHDYDQGSGRDIRPIRYENKGPLGLNEFAVGKVKEYREESRQRNGR